MKTGGLQQILWAHSILTRCRISTTIRGEILHWFIRDEDTVSATWGDWRMGTHFYRLDHSQPLCINPFPCCQIRVELTFSEGKSKSVIDESCKFVWKWNTYLCKCKVIYVGSAANRLLYNHTLRVHRHHFIIYNQSPVAWVLFSPTHLKTWRATSKKYIAGLAPSTDKLEIAQVLSSWLIVDPQKYTLRALASNRMIPSDGT